MGTLTITDPATGKKQKFGYEGDPPTDEELQGLISKAFPSSPAQNPNTVMLPGIDGKMYPAERISGGALRYRVPAGGKDPFAIPGSPIAKQEPPGAYDRIYDPASNSTKIVPQATKQPSYFGPAQTGGLPIPTHPGITGPLPTLENKFDTFMGETVPKNLHRLGKLGELAVEHGFGSIPLTEVPNLDEPYHTVTPDTKFDPSNNPALDKRLNNKVVRGLLNAPGDAGQVVEGLPSFAIGGAQAAGAGIAAIDPKSRANALPQVQAFKQGLSEAASGGPGGWYEKAKNGNFSGAVDDLESGAALHPVQTVLLIAGLGHGGIKAADIAQKVMLKKAVRLDAQAAASSDPAKIRANAEQADLYREQAQKLQNFVQKVTLSTPEPQVPDRVAPPLQVPARVTPGVAPPVGIPDTIAGKPTNMQVPAGIPELRRGENGKPIVRIVKGKMVGPKEPSMPAADDLPGLLEYSKGAKDRLDKSVQDLKDEGRRNAQLMEEYQARVDAGLPPRRDMNAGRIGAGAPTYQVPLELQKSFKIGEAPKTKPGEAPTLADTINNDEIMKVKDAPSFREAVKKAFNLSDEQADHVATITDALAKHDEKTRGISPYDWYQQRFKGMIRGGDSTIRPQGLYQGGPQNLQTETPEFKNWFGESKVVDESGQPLVVYHGTYSPADFTQFRTGQGIGATIQDTVGAHFGSSDSANARLKTAPKNGPGEVGKIYPVYLKAEKPFTKSDGSYFTEGEMRSKLNAIAKKLGIQNPGLRGRGGIEVRDYLRKQGYDSIPYRNSVEDKGHTSWISLDPRNIKSAIGNRGTFDPNSPNILYQADEPFYSQAERVVQANNQKTMSGDQWQGFLNSRGVKPDEMKWTGLGDFLDEKGTGQVSKQEVLDHLTGNKVQLNEITKGGGQNGATPEEWARYNELKDLDAQGKITISQYHEMSDLVAKFKANKVSPTKYGSYQLPGGKNYREHLLQLPVQSGPSLTPAEVSEMTRLTDVPWRDRTAAQTARLKELNDKYGASVTPTRDAYHSSHWDEPNVLAHIRTSDRVGPNGEKILHVEEVQSDWHQAGRKSGYVDRNAIAKEKAAAEKALNEAEQQYKQAKKAHDAQDDESWGKYPEGNMPPEEVEKLNKAWDNLKAAEENESKARTRLTDTSRYVPSDAPPAAPFSKTWHELAAKKILDMAAREGYDKVTWTPGEEQGKRYSEDAGGPKDQARTAGMKGFYDKILPDTFNKLGKRFGAKVGEAELEPLDRTQNGKYRVIHSNGMRDYFDTPEEARAFAASVGLQDGKLLHSIDIPDAMRKTILDEGQPLFQKNGPKQAKGQATILANKQAILRGFEKSDLSTALHETFHAILPHLADSDIAVLTKHFGVGDDGMWSVEAQEGAARAWERYFHNGEAPTEELKGVFAKIKAVMRAIYKKVNKDGLHPEVRDTFDRILGKYDEPVETKPKAPEKAAETPEEGNGPTASPSAKNAPTATQEPKSKPPADQNADIHGFKMAAIEQVAAKHGITLPDRSEFKEGWKAVEQRALANYAEIKHSLGMADLEKNPNLTAEEVYVGNTRLRQLSEDIVPKLLNSIANAKEADKPRLQAKLDVALAETDRVSNMLYKSGSAAGRRLAYQKAFVSGPFDGASIMKKATAAANGTLTKEAQTSIIRLVDRGKTLEQKQSAARLDRAQRALEQLQRVTKDITLDDIRGCK